MGYKFADLILFDEKSVMPKRGVQNVQTVGTRREIG